MNAKKLHKRLSHAEMVWQREQIKAAMIAESLDKAVATIEQYKDELNEEQVKAAYEQVQQRRDELEEYLLKAKNKYLAKLHQLGVDPTLVQTSKPLADTLSEL